MVLLTKRGYFNKINFGEKMKHLTIVYNNVTMFDGEIEEFSWTDTASGVKVEGRLTPLRGNGNGMGSFFDSLLGASKAKTEQKVAEGKADLEEKQLEDVCE